MHVCMYAFVQRGCAWMCQACPESVREVLLTTDNISVYTESAIQIVVWNFVAN